MFIKQDEVFDYQGRQLRARRAPKKGWPCQMCELASRCDSESYQDETFPQCRGMDREDKVSVVFVDATPAPPRKGGRR